ncbi:MAG TPA: PKD domain-containing protein, partial [Bacteroidia bacterium]|nr:PKD domain-containing protein [Bacteroidia bacterium]
MISFIKSIYKATWAAVIIAAGLQAKGQSCSINGPADVCLGSVSNFSVTANPSPISYSWDFGDGNSSTQASPSYLYSAEATRQVKVILTLPGGQTCTATHNVVIHPKPVADFSINSSSVYCFSKNEVCITDNSTPGPTGNPLNKRVFLWDDGAGDNTGNPSAQKIICHSYQFTGTYSLVMEITDDKGCQSKVNKNIIIKPDYKVSFFSNLVINPLNCKWQVCFDNETKPEDTSDLASYEWNFGDGEKDVSFTNYGSVCHDYDSNGSFTARLVVRHKSGCIDSAVQAVNIAKPDINFNLQMKRSICFGDKITMFNNALNPGARYRWFVKDSASGIEKPLPDQTNPVVFDPVSPGKYYIKLNIYRDSCQKNGFDSVDVKCPLAEVQARNDRLCAEGDTTYFCDASCYFRSYHSKVFWDFQVGEACTTDISKGQNVDRNCRYSVDKNPKHLFNFSDTGKKTSCYNVQLIVKDTVTGCESKGSKQVLMGLPSFENLIVDHKALRYCQDLGAIDAERVVNFYISGLKCDGWDMFLNFDSLFDPYNFSKVTPTPPPQKTYYSTADPEGYLTIGFAVQNGNQQKFTSCNTLSADSGKTCADTVWYHHKFDMAPVPNPYINTWDGRGCAPFNFTLRPDDTVQYGLSKAIWEWGDGGKDSFEFNPGDTVIPTRYHTYWKNGLYTPSITLVNRRGCAETQFLTVGLGYFNFVQYDSLVCAGDSVQLTEFLSYYDIADTFWLDTNRALAGKERVWWDFDDGNGFITKPPKKRWVFPSEGTYRVRMASVDSVGCPDTFSFTVKAVKADANIKLMPDSFYCNDNILRFFDSSFGSPEIPGDVVTQWTWSFGDGKNNSFLQDPFHYYSSFGKKTISLAVKSKEGCRDTTYKDIVIVGPVPNFEIVSDSVGCDPLVVTFKNTSGRVKNWIWYLGDPANTIMSTNKDTGFTFTYSPPGTYYIKLYGSDSIYNPQTGNTYFCSAFYPDTPLVKKVVVLPYFPVGIDLPD